MTRAERRRRRILIIARRRRIVSLWHSLHPSDRPEANPLWRKCAKNNFAHGCPLCHYEKYDRKNIRKRRRELDAEIEFNVAAWRERT